VLSIIIPTLNEAASIDRVLAAVAKIEGPTEVIVVDGGSKDDTAQLVRARGVRLIESERGRGAQMQAGARASGGEVLWFLHADTIPPRDSLKLIAGSLSDPKVISGCFDVYFDSRRISVHFLCWFYRRLRSFGVCYGDAAIFVRREAYELVGGYKSLALFEDLDLVRRLRRYGRMARVPAAVTTSARRFERRSFALTFARWTFLQILYWLGVSPQRLNRLYAPIRDAKVSRII
jgi:rSAM/selenodomain-associated transferase 2